MVKPVKYEYDILQACSVSIILKKKEKIRHQGNFSSNPHLHEGIEGNTWPRSIFFLWLHMLLCISADGLALAQFTGKNHMHHSIHVASWPFILAQGRREDLSPDGCGFCVPNKLLHGISRWREHHWWQFHHHFHHYSDVIMGVMASQIPSLTIVYTTVYSGADQRKYQSSTSLAFVQGIHRWPVSSPHKWPVTRKMFLFDDVIVSNNMEMSRHENAFCITVFLWPLLYSPTKVQ